MRNGEVEFMQALFPEAMIIMAVIAVIAMLFTYRRINNT